MALEDNFGFLTEFLLKPEFSFVSDANSGEDCILELLRLKNVIMRFDFGHILAQSFRHCFEHFRLPRLEVREQRVVVFLELFLKLINSALCMSDFLG